MDDKLIAKTAKFISLKNLYVYGNNLPTNPVFPPCGTTAKLYEKHTPGVLIIRAS